jgi:RNA:NAD 2'-phosphotransferase (TPT1/KptA family)
MTAAIIGQFPDDYTAQIDAHAWAEVNARLGRLRRYLGAIARHEATRACALDARTNVSEQ